MTLPTTLDSTHGEDETGRVEGVGIAVVVFGPLLVFILLIFKATRKLMPRREARPPWRGQDDEPKRPGETSGDREPRRPLTPSLSGAIALAPPTTHDDEPREVAIHRIESQSDGGGDQRLAG